MTIAGRDAATHAKSKVAEATRYLQDAQEISRAFVLYRDQRSKLVLRFANDASMYTARLLDVTDSELLIEDLQPRSGLSLLRVGTKFSLSCRSQGQFVMAEDNQVCQTSVERGVPYFHVALPNSILYQQRRRDSRMSMSLTVLGQGAYMQLTANHRTTGEPMAIRGDIIDLSAGGCRARFNSTASTHLVKDALLESCQLNIRDQLQLTSSVSVRHRRWDAEQERLECGFEFVRMSITDRRRLEQFVQTVARNQPPVAATENSIRGASAIPIATAE